MERTPEGLTRVQRALRSRFDDFRRALDRRDAPAYRFGLFDFARAFRLWSEAGQRALLPAVVRAGVPGRDPARELRLEWVQLRELARFLLEQIDARAPIADVLGLADNLERRLAAHEQDMEIVYYPTAAPALTEAEWETLDDAALDG